MIKKVLATCVGAALAVLLVGCAGGNSDTETKKEEAPVAANDKAAEYTIVGEQASGNTEVLTTNKTEQAISSLSLKAADAKDFTDNLVKESTTVASGEQFLLCFKPAGTDTTYEMAITLADGAEYTLTELRLTDYKSMDIIVKDDKAFVTYTTLSNQNGSSPQVAKTGTMTEAPAQTNANQAATDTGANQSNATSSNANGSNLPSDSMDNWTQDQWENSEFVDSEQYRGDAGPVNPEDLEGYQGSDVSD